MIEKSAFASYSDIEKLDVSEQSTFSETVRHSISKKDSVENEADAGGFEMALAEYMFTIDDALTTSSRSEIFFPIMRSVLISIASNGERLFFQQTADRKRLSETLRDISCIRQKRT